MQKAYSWGYDECEFFPKAFAYIRQQQPHPVRLFAQVVVSRNHFSFDDNILDENRPFATPANFAERYLNSLGHQDNCLEVFWREFSAYAGENSHLFVFGDHSWPIGINGNSFNETGAHPENFAVPILYIPPGNRCQEFAVGTRSDVWVAQADIPSTILELLDLGHGSNSFASLLKGENTTSYEDCHIVVQPYTDASINVMRKGYEYAYHLSTQTLTRINLTESLAEGPEFVVARQIPYSQFKSDYGCVRYR